MRTYASVVAAICLFLLLMPGCSGGRMSRFPGMNFDPRPEDHPIAVYHVKLPECPFEEIGTAKAHGAMGGGWGSDREAALEALKRLARRMGGDAVAGLHENRETVTFYYEATVIRFTDPNCMK